DWFHSRFSGTHMTYLAHSTDPTNATVPAVVLLCASSAPPAVFSVVSAVAAYPPRLVVVR
ncbi:hypothetical protein LZC00_09845, partial [Campylobacter coli]|uniref:hypothetical protein n=1 Tax=Campylobacter coli TaxID=195 RepID=UPI001F08883E